MSQSVKLLHGSPVADHIRHVYTPIIAELRARGVTPCLATVLVGDDPASRVYVQMKAQACERWGITSRRVHIDGDAQTDEVIRGIEALGRDEHVHGILLQHPCPPHVDERRAFEAIPVEKDVDGVTAGNFGRTALGMEGFAACTPRAILALLDFYKLPIAGKHAVVIGRSPILGRPVAELLINRNATVTLCHSHTRDLPSHVAQADLVVAAVGKPRFVQGAWIKPGTVVLDAGYNPGNVGDVDFDACALRAGAITPVPGGVGPVTIATLLGQTIEAARRFSGARPGTLNLRGE